MKKRTHRRVKNWRSALAFGAVVTLAAVVSAGDVGSMRPPAGPGPIRFSDVAFVHVARRPARKVFPFSVIPGGVRTRMELTDAIARDGVVAAHYRSISTGAVRSEEVKEDRLAYMSYRMGNKIYWTKHKIRLKQGETILTDGVTQIRARCGNCIALQPMLPTSDTEPEAAQFDALTAPPSYVETPAPLETAELGAGQFHPSDVTLGTEGLNMLPLGSELAAAPSFAGGIVPTTPVADSPGSSSGDTPGSPSTESQIPAPFPPITLPPTDTSANVPGAPGIPPVVASDTVPKGDNLPPTSTFVPEGPVGGGPEQPGGPTPIPEPATLLLVGGGLTFLSRRRARR
jgi:hypothetical protein